MIDDLRKLCEIGDKLFRVGKDSIEEITIVDIKSYPHFVYKDDKGHSYFNRNIGKNCFKTHEEAKQEVQKRINIIEKRKRLKEYERQLNEELNITDHFIIK